MGAMTERKACIVGAGIGGLAAAIALKRTGWAVKVFERSAAPRELGFALLLAPNAVRALRRLGLAETVVKAGHRTQRGEIRRPDGTRLRGLDTAAVEAALGEPTVVALRPVLHGALMAQLSADELALAAPARGFEASDSGASLLIENGERYSANVLIGADGVGSVIRRALHPSEAPPKASGLIALRGVAHGVAKALGDCGAAQYLGDGVEAGLARASEDVVYWYLSLKAERADGAEENPRAFLERYVAKFHAGFRDIALATRPEDLRFDRLFERATLPRWGQGAVTLLGDAAHPMLPHAGQGAAQALEDAVAVARALARTASVEAALRRYETVRSERTRKVVQLARRNATVGSVTGALPVWLRDTAVRLVPEKVLLQSMIALGRPPAEP
jgi:2-polyprenyl-6-methoxyphenol hydroxylase-like FAD-dependent oxidoreductase